MQTTVGQYLLKADDMSGVTPLRCARHRIHRPLVRRLDHPLWRVVYVEHLFDRWNKRGGFDRGPVSFIFVRHNLMKPADNEAIAWLRLRWKKKPTSATKTTAVFASGTIDRRHLSYLSSVTTLSLYPIPIFDFHFPKLPKAMYSASISLPAVDTVLLAVPTT